MSDSEAAVEVEGGAVYGLLKRLIDGRPAEMRALGWSWLYISLVVYQVLRRAGNFAFARPTREVLFTVVPREDKYKAKSFIDTVIYRGGDQVGA
jgi:hypothetical protein